MVYTNMKGGVESWTAMAECALEEIGKSFTCLAYYAVADSVTDWTAFWKDWKDHKVKAHSSIVWNASGTSDSRENSESIGNSAAVSVGANCW
jgi:AbiV family abortive infection protein